MEETKPKYRLTSAELRAKQHPETFKIPPASVRSGLRRGMFAKLLFDDKERMWVLIDNILPGPRYRGTLRNLPVVIDTIRLDDEVEFGPEHVCDIERPEE